ncbi:MAG: terminase small subunit [Clostridiales bacterium]|nr:terminase small subunit [Clostridiales bacterium]
MAAKKNNMTAKQRRFCDEYLVDMNATQAAIRAGYSAKTADAIGKENLRKPLINAYISSELERIHDEKTADAKEVMEYLTSVMRGEQEEKALRMIGNGVQNVIDIDVSAKDRIKAAELIGKAYGVFKENMAVAVEPITIVEDLKG